MGLILQVTKPIMKGFALVPSCCEKLYLNLILLVLMSHHAKK